MKRNTTVKGNKTIYASNQSLWDAFIKRAYLEEMSVSSLLEKAMTFYLANTDRPGA